MSSSRWGPPVKSGTGTGDEASDTSPIPIPPPPPMTSLASEESLGGSNSSVGGVLVPPELPADADFEYIAAVEWGPRRNEDGYDTDQELVPQPMPERTDLCGCQRPSDTETGCMACIDDSCILFACREECRKNCEAGDACGNRRIQLGQFKQLEVFDAGFKGKGLKVMEDSKLGDIITEYVGRAVKQDALNRLFRRYKLDRMLYIMALDNGVYLDARKKGGLARYINHSCDPNCKVERWKVRGILRAAVVTLRDLKAGEELTFDYQWERKRGRATTKCHCGSTKCRGTLELAKSLEEQRQQQELEGYCKKMTITADHNIINRTVQVFSQEHQEYFWGEVTGYDAEKKLHSILLSHDLSEDWVDLAKEDWRILDEEVDKSNFFIAKKIQQQPSTSAPTSLLQAVNGDAPPTKHFLYIQTPIKQIFWSKHWVERCERNCQVQVQAQQMARPPLPPNMDDPEDVEKYQALDNSKDGTVWKLTISGSNVPAAHNFLEKSAASLQKKVELEAFQAQASAAPTLARVLVANTAPSSLDQHEVVIPRLIVDGVKKRLPSVREKCRSVNILFAPSESKSKQFSRLILEGSLLSDIEAAKEHLWALLIELCEAADAPATPNKMYRDLGFLGGALSNAQFRLLCGAPKDSLRVQAKEDLQRSPFFASFESSYRCTVWVQSEEDKGRINANNRIVDEATAESPRKVFFGCHPKEIPRLWSLVQSRAGELARGVKFLYLGLDRVYQQLMMKNGGQFFEYVKKVVGAAVTIDSMTGDHLRIDGRPQSDDWNAGTEGSEPEMTEDERASMAEELIRLQIELYRDHCIRQQSWLCGRDWTLVASTTVPPNNADSKQAIQSLGNLDSRSTAQGCMELSEIVANLGLPANVSAHAAIILYRFVSAKGSSDMQIKTREAVLACVFLANKAQKATKWKRLDAVLEAGYKTFYPGTKFDRNQEAVVVLEDKVIAAEKEILQTLDYDIFWCETEGIVVVATGAGKQKESFVESVFALAFSGPVLAAGPELWLKYGTEYVFAAAAAFLKANLEDLLPPMGLIPLKVSQAAEVLVESAKIGRSSSSKMPSHPLVAGKKERIEKYLPRIKEACVEIMKKSILNRSPTVLAGSSEIEQRYRITGERSCRRHTIRGVVRAIVQDHIVPIIDGIAAESTCLIFLAESGQGGAEDIVLEGPWRAVAIADHMLRAATKDITSLPPSVDSTAELQESSKIQAKVQSGLLRVSDIQTTDDWEGTIQANEPDQKVSGRRVGGKCALAGKIPESALRESGLRWWIPPRYGPSPSGSVQDMFLIRSNPSEQLDALSRLTMAFVGQSKAFPMLTSRLVRAPEGGGNRAVAVSIQRWPSEKVSNKELEASEKSKGKRMQMGFSAAALQEMQLLRQLHGLIPSPQGHPNFILPVGVAVPGNDDLSNHVSPASGDVGSSSLLSMDDPMFSLFRSSEENEKAAEKAQKLKSGPHLLFHPTPYVLQRFMSRRTQKSEEFSISPGILASWFHDLLSALVHCHSNHVVLKNIQPDQILVDHSGVAKLGGLYRATVLPPDERRKPINALKAALKSKIKKKDAEDDYSNNPYAAPEVLMGCPKFSKESDIWSMGCLLATLVLNKPLFVGKDRAALLASQFKIVGYPGKDNYEEGAKYPYYTKPEKKGKRYRRNVEKAMEHMLKENHSQYAKVIDLLAQMLHLDPEKRCTAAEALGHDFMVEYAENCNSEAFRQSYVADWMALKETLLHMGDSVKEKERTQKRKAMMLAATKTSNDDTGDDLYDLDEILDEEEPAKKQKIGTM
jgi:serine/threonine protein kinase